MLDSPAHLRARATELRRFARRLDELLVLDLHRRAGPDTWVGPSPQACHTALALLRARFGGAADDVRRAAARLERVAAELEAAARAAGAP